LYRQPTINIFNAEKGVTKLGEGMGTKKAKIYRLDDTFLSHNNLD